MKNTKFTQSEICKAHLENVKGGEGHPDRCPRCENMEWDLILEPQEGYQCTRCGYFVPEHP